MIISVEKLKILLCSLRRGTLAGDLQKTQAFGAQAIPESSELGDLSNAKNRCAVTFHIYYEEFISTCEAFLKQLPKDIPIFFTSCNSSIYSQMMSICNSLGLESHGRIVENRGRNFGPLFVEFANQLKNFEYFVHVHSKMSKHTRSKSVNSWNFQLHSLLSDWPKIVRATNLMRCSNVGLVFPSVSGVVRRINFYWNNNFEPVSKLALEEDLLEEIHTNTRFSFPAGGMFVVRTEAIIQLLKLNWEVEQFPLEVGQLDGTLQHGLERAIGRITIANGYRNAEYRMKEDKFWLLD